jgi:hypothetical protein
MNLQQIGTRFAEIPSCYEAVNESSPAALQRTVSWPQRY